MLELVGIKKETSADIFLREFQAYQKESVTPVYNREFIAFQKESKENIESSPISSLKDVQKENPTKSSEDGSSVTKINKTSSSGLKTPDIDSQVASFLAVCVIFVLSFSIFGQLALRSFTYISNDCMIIFLFNKLYKIIFLDNFYIKVFVKYLQLINSCLYTFSFFKPAFLWCFFDILKILFKCVQ